MSFAWLVGSLFFKGEGGIGVSPLSRGLGDVYESQAFSAPAFIATSTFARYGPASAFVIGLDFIFATAFCTSAGISILYDAFFKKPSFFPRNEVPLVTPFAKACFRPEAASHLV